MFEQLDTSESNTAKDKVTVGESLGVYVLLLSLGFGSFLAFIMLENLPYGIQFASMISYSGFVFIYTFFRTRGIDTKHSLADFYVQRLLPRLLAIHCGYLAVLFAGESLVFWNRKYLSLWWTTSGDQRGMPPITFLLVLTFGAMAVSEVWLCRSLLSRAKKERRLAEDSNS